MKKFLVFVVFLLSIAPVKIYARAAGMLSSMSGMFGDFFASKGGVNIEQIMLVTDEKMNHGGALTAHLVIVYEKELIGKLKQMSSRQYFQMKDQLIKDYPDKLKVFEWELVAKERITPWKDINYPVDHMVPVAAFIYANYNSAGEHRERISPDPKKVKVVFESNDFKAHYEDKDNKNDDDDDEENDNDN